MTVSKLAALAGLREGSLAEVPFGALLLSLSLQRASIGLKIHRGHIFKTVLLERGVPVDCRSNDVQETLGEFLVREGRISSFQCRESLLEAAARGVRVGEILVEMGFIDSLELHDALQRNLASTLLDCFTWTDGRFSVLPELPALSANSVVNVPQLVFTGLTRFTALEQMDAWVGSLRGRRMVLESHPTVRAVDLRLSSQERRVLTGLRKPCIAEEILSEIGMPHEQGFRTLAALVMMGVASIRDETAQPVMPDDDIEVEIVVVAHEMDKGPAIASDRRLSQWKADTPNEASPQSTECYRQIMTEHAAHRGKDAFDILGVAVDASDAEIRARYLELTARYAPVLYQGPELRSIAPKVDDLLRATVSAYHALCDVHRRADIAQARREPQEADPPTSPERVPLEAVRERSPADEHARRGFDQLVIKRFASASECFALALQAEPQNSDYRAHYAYARARSSNEGAEEAMEKLIELGSVQARLYAAEVCHTLGDTATAQDHFLQACSAWAGSASH